MQNPTSENQIWRCVVCGYLHEGPEPPEECPVCGAKANEFEHVDQPAAASVAIESASEAASWRCLICEHIHVGGKPSEQCPVCGASGHEFEPVSGPEQTVEKVTYTQFSTGKLVIIGGGIAGITAAEACKEAKSQSEITIVNEEPGLPYYRLNLTRYLAGEVNATSLPIRNPEWFDKNNITLLDNTSAVKLDPKEQIVMLADGTELSYDRLLLCPGSHPYIPPLPGSQLSGVKTLRTKEDADEILRLAGEGGKCVVIGGGVLGIETAGALARRQVDVTLLESHQWLMPRQLNNSAAERIKKHLQQIGVKLKQEAKTSRFNGSDEGGLESVLLQSGEEIPADLAILTTGIRANTALARKAGLKVEAGIVVDNHLRSSQPNIFAAGDAAEHNGTLYGLWNASQYQGKIAGVNVAGGNFEFGGLPRNNTLKLAGIELCSIGEVQAADGSYMALEENSENSFFRLLFHDGYMVGAILIDEAAEFSVIIKKAIESRQHFELVLRHQPRVGKILEELDIK